MRTIAATLYVLIVALILTAAYGCSGPPAASDPPDPSKVIDNPAIPPDPAIAPGPLVIISERSSSATPSEIVVPYIPKSSESDAPHQRFLDGKQFMLGLINEERKKAGVPDVSLGDNNAAQIHVENSISDCVSGHWGTDGLGPPMRYSLAGSYQSNGENASGYNYCLTDEDRPSYRPIQSVQSELRDHMNGYLGSPGHKENILYQWHRKVNLGLSWDTHQMWTVQQFEGDYANCSVPPTIQGTTLRASCTVDEVLPSRSLAQAVYYDSPPHALTQGQIARSHSYRLGRKAALLRQKAQPGYSYMVNEVTQTHYSGCTPYDVDPTEPAPSSFAEATTLHNEAKLCEPLAETITVPWIDGEETISGSAVSLSHDIGQVLREHGSGVYTLYVWGCLVADSVEDPCEDENSMPVLTQSIFYGIEPPDTYTPTLAPTPTPTPTATTQRVGCGSAVTDKSNTGLVADCEILLGMKPALRGSAKLNWWSGRSIEKWDGIKVQGGRVTELSLPNRNLDGILPVGLGSLSALTTLDLSSNSLTGTIPTELNNLTNLTRWRLAGNSFSGCVPYNFAQVSDNDAASLGLATCGGGTTTPTPVPTVTPTSNPIALACDHFAQATADAYQATVDFSHQADDNHKYHDTLRLGIRSRIETAYNLTKSYPAIERALGRIWWLYRLSDGRVTDSGTAFRTAILGGRQFARICESQDYTTPTFSPDVLTEYACQGPILTYGEAVNPSLTGYRCNMGHEHSNQ